MQLTAKSQLGSWHTQISSFISVISGVQPYAVALALKKTRDTRHLKELPDYLLDDVGLERADIEPAVAAGYIARRR